jgi:hypothetical protein
MLGYIGLQCMLCDEENGYALHQPGNKCTQCGENEGRNSVIFVVASFAALALLVGVFSKYRLLNRMTATSKVIICGGEHKGLLGELPTKLSELEMEGRYQVKLKNPATTGGAASADLTLRGAQLELVRIDLQEEYQKRLMKIKLLVQFVTVSGM